jgi:predicted RNA-binding protein
MIDKIIKDKSILVGDEKVIKQSKWVPFSEISTSLDVLNHHIFSDAFQNILKTFKTTHKIAFMSMCTSTRPYYLSRKWKEFKNHFDGLMDLIVISNGGIIPEEYWESYPYLNYDGAMSGCFAACW